WHEWPQQCRAAGHQAVVPTTSSINHIANGLGLRVARVQLPDGGVVVKTDGPKKPLPPIGVAVNSALRFEPGNSVVVTKLANNPPGRFTLEAFVTPTQASYGGNPFVLSFPAQAQIMVNPVKQSWYFYLQLDDKQTFHSFPIPIVKDRRTHVAGVRTESEL